MYAFYTYKPSIEGQVGKQLSLQEILDLRFASDEAAKLKNTPRSKRTEEYIHGHRHVALQYPGVEPWMLAPVLEGRVISDVCPLQVVSEYYAQKATRAQAAAFARRYFERVKLCLVSQRHDGFGKPKTVVSTSFYDHMPHYPTQAVPFPSLRQMLYALAEKNGEALPAVLADAYVTRHTKAVSEAYVCDPFTLSLDSYDLPGWSSNPNYAVLAMSAYEVVLAHYTPLVGELEAESIARQYSIALRNGLETPLYSILIKPKDGEMKVFVAATEEAAKAMLFDLTSGDASFEIAQTVAVSRY